MSVPQYRSFQSTPCDPCFFGFKVFANEISICLIRPQYQGLSCANVHTSSSSHFVGVDNSEDINFLLPVLNLGGQFLAGACKSGCETRGKLVRRNRSLQK